VTFVAVPDKAVGDIFSELMWDASIRDNLNAGVLRPIADNLLGSGAASVTISGIPATFAHLLAIWHTRSDTATATQNQFIRLNADAGANYDYQDFSANNTTLGSAELYATTSIACGQMPAFTAGANLFAVSYCLLLNYANTSNHKCLVGYNGMKQGTATGNIKVYEFAGWYRSTAAIPSITWLPAANNFVTGSRFTVYGIGLI